MNRSKKALGLALTLSFVAVACAAPAIPGDDGSLTDPATAKKPTTTKTPANDNDASTPAVSPTDPAPGDPTPAPPPGTPAPTDCSSSADYDSCFTCCDTPTGGDLGKADDAFGQCACDPGGACASACGATFCTGAAPSAACDACLTNTCEPQADGLCTSAACQAGLQCLQASGCDAKP
jgi:hypothetical protein